MAIFDQPLPLKTKVTKRDAIQRLEGVRREEAKVQGAWRMKTQKVKEVPVEQ